MKKRVTLAFVFYGLSCIALASDEQTGIWSPDSTFAQLNVACVRTYTCGPSDAEMYSADQKIVASGPRQVTGVCSAGDGPVGSCNVCLTNPPSDPCKWHLERR